MALRRTLGAGAVLLLAGVSLPAAGFMLPPAVPASVPLASWDFGDATPLVDNIAGRVITINNNDPGDIVLSSLTDSNGVTLGVLDFVDADRRSYATTPHVAADQLDSGVIFIRGINTGQFNDAIETIVSKDHNGFGTGGHFTVDFVRTTDTTGNIEVRLQSTSADNFVMTTNPLNLDEYVDVVVTFGPAYGGLQLYVDRDLSDAVPGMLEDSNAFLGGISGNLEPWVFGSSMVNHNPPASQSGIDPNDLRYGLSGAIAGFEIYQIPEPATAFLLLAGGLSAGVLRRRRRRA